MAKLDGSKMTFGECLVARAKGDTVVYPRKKTIPKPPRERTTLEHRFEKLFAEYKECVMSRKGNREILVRLVRYVGRMPKNKALISILEIARIEGVGCGLLTLYGIAKNEFSNEK